MKAVVAAFNQEKALVGAFSVITNLRMQLFEAPTCVEVERALQTAHRAEAPAGAAHGLVLHWGDCSVQPAAGFMASNRRETIERMSLLLVPQIDPSVKLYNHKTQC